MASVQINTVFNIDLEFEIAPFHKRLLAYLIDFALLIIYLYAMKTLLYDALGLGSANAGFDIVMVSLPMLLYSLVAEISMNGQTIGKRMMRIRVISLNGSEPTAGQYILRWITKFFEWPFFFGYIYFADEVLFAYIIITGLLGIAVLIVISLSPKSQRLGDIAAGTVVIDTRSNMSVHDTIFMHVNAEHHQVKFPQVMRLTDNDINTIKTVVTQAHKRHSEELCYRVQTKIKNVLQLESDLEPLPFLEKLLEDYNYLATKE
ncbi:MAG: RDD family protein [Chitinophagaceae bacterium]|nr:MAG: RDD family protein [Chitinophagaceae bacterium]